MDFTWSDEEKQLYAEFEKVCKKIEERADELDRTASLDLIKQNLEELAKFGYLGAPLPTEYGGGGLRWTTYFWISELLAKACASTYLSALAHTLLCANFIAMFGTEEQKRKFLPDLASGKKIGALCVTEPQGGSDVAGIKTRAERDRDGYILNGTKVFVTNGPIADVFVVLARIPNGGEKRYEGITAFIVERGTEGLEVGKPYDKMGCRGSPTSDLHLSDVRVGRDAVIGGVEGQGFRQVMRVFDIGRVGMSIYSLGIVWAALEECIRYSRERVLFGKAIANYEDINFKIVDMQITVDMGRAIVLKASWLHDMGSEDGGLFASIAKLFITERATRNLSDAVQIFGGLGYIRGTKVERLYRDVKLGEIGEGTSEIQRRIIFKRMLREFGLTLEDLRKGKVS